MAEVAETRAKNAELKLASLESNASDIITKFNSFPGQTSVASLRQDAHFGTYLAHAFNPTIKLETDPETGKLILKKKPLPLGTEPKPEEQKKDQ
jgi:hypothetical protein